MIVSLHLYVALVDLHRAESLIGESLVHTPSNNDNHRDKKKTHTHTTDEQQRTCI